MNLLGARTYKPAAKYRMRRQCPLLGVSGHQDLVPLCLLLTQSGHYAVKHSWLCSAVDVRFLMQNDIQQ